MNERTDSKNVTFGAIGGPCKNFVTMQNFVTMLLHVSAIMYGVPPKCGPLGTTPLAWSLCQPKIRVPCLDMLPFTANLSL